MKTVDDAFTASHCNSAPIKKIIHLIKIRMSSRYDYTLKSYLAVPLESKRVWFLSRVGINLHYTLVSIRTHYTEYYNSSPSLDILHALLLHVSVSFRWMTVKAVVGFRSKLHQEYHLTLYLI